jgi:hypothetical protein
MADGSGGGGEWEDPENSLGLYILVGRIPVTCSDAVVWGEWMSDFRNRNVAGTWVRRQRWVSTIFLGIDHNILRFLPKPDRRPLLFETMIFKGRLAEAYQTRASTWPEAEAMHLEAIEWVHRQQVKRRTRR